MKNFQPKWRSRPAWEATAALVILLLKKAVGVEFDVAWANLVVDAVLIAAGAWGVWNDPNDSDNY